MPTLKILIGDKLVDAEIVVRDGALLARVPDEYLSSSMPVLTAKLEAQTQAADMLLQVGDLVRAAEQRFPTFYAEKGRECAKMAAREYQLCRELYEAGKSDQAKERLSALREHVRQDMVSLEMRNMVAEELRKKSTRKVKVTREDGQEVFYVVARFDGVRLEAKLFGGELKEPVGELLELAESFTTSSIKSSNPCSCNCDPPSGDDSGSVGYQFVIQRFSGAIVECVEHKPPVGSTTNKFKTYTCSVNERSGSTCYKSRIVFFPEASS